MFAPYANLTLQTRLIGFIFQYLIRRSAEFADVLTLGISNEYVADDIFLGGQSTTVRAWFSFVCLVCSLSRCLDVLSAALDAGLALSVVTIFFA